MNAIKIALIGFGKIARDQHVPALADNAAFELVAVASPNSRHESVAHFDNIDALLASVTKLDAVSICTTPQVRYDIARKALERGCHVMLEKPPGATVSEVTALIRLAQDKQLALFATWHSREAAAVEPARAWLQDKKILRAAITWKEDVRVWHPGQRWIWQPGGLGVFDPGINALSIATRILPNPLVLTDAELLIPTNCATPIAANLKLDTQGAPVDAEFDFRQTGKQSWDIQIDTDAGHLLLANGGATLNINDAPIVTVDDQEYPRLYEQFAELIEKRAIDADVSPLQLVADAFLCGRVKDAEPFSE